MPTVVIAVIPPKASKPGPVFDKILSAVENEMRANSKDIIKREMGKRVKNWGTKPEFAGRYSRIGGVVGSMYVFPRGGGMTLSGASGRDLWTFVSLGTRDRPIVPRNKPQLIFRRGYKARTAPGNVYGRSSSRFGPVIKTTLVRHHSIKARKFEEHIVNDAQVVTQIVRGMQAAIKAVPGVN